MDFTGKRVLVTGSRGFIGSHLVCRLEQEGAEVIGVDISDGIDITDRSQLKGCNNIDFIYHLAAKVNIPAAAADSGSTYFTNVAGTLNMLELGRQNQVSKFIFASTYVYGRPQYLPVDEKHPVNPVNPYSRSKVLGEELCRAYHDDCGLKCVIIRAFNIYGEGQGGDFLIPGILRQIAGDAIRLDDAEPKRDFLYVDDAVAAYIKAAGYTGADFAVFNIGSGKSYSVAGVVDRIMSVAGKKLPVQYRQKRRKNELMDVVADIAKARRELGWEPEIDFEEGLRRCVEWYKKSGGTG